MPTFSFPVCRLLNYVDVPARTRGEYFLLSGESSVVHQDFFPPSDAFDESLAPQHSPYFSELIDLCDVQDLRSVSLYDSIYFVREADVDRFPAGLYKTTIISCVFPR